MLKAFADDLKFIREEKNISLKTISQQTRLNIAILENLENGDYTFQPQTYIRAFLKQYINALDLDVEETLFDYDLARSGKYKAKRQNSGKNIITAEEQPVPEKENKSTIAEKLKQIADTPKEDTNKLEKADNEKQSGFTSKNYPEGKKPEHKVSLKQDEVKNEKYSPGKKNFIASVLSHPVVRNITLILFILLVLLGLYSLIDILFLDKSKDKPDVIRQNFDEVVKEQERKILGKRSPEEIQDSIRKAEEEAAASKDSITLTITALKDGSFFLVTDSLDYNKPQKIEFTKNQYGVFKAKKFFHLSSGNTSTFKAAVNDTPIKFDKQTVSKVKITKSGITE